MSRTFEDDASTAAAAFEDEGRGDAPGSFEGEVASGDKAKRGQRIAGKLRRGKGGGPRKDDADAFENPLGPDRAEDKTVPLSRQSNRAESSDLGQAPWVSSEDEKQQAAAIAAMEGEQNLGRDRWSYVVMNLGICLLLPFFVALAVLSVWMLWLAPNPMSWLVAMVSTTVPAVMLIGRMGASRSSQAMLQAFSFLMTLAISMQLSVCVIFWLDDGTFTDAFIDSCETTVQEICNSDNYELWESALPVSDSRLRDACRCAGDGDGSDVGDANVAAGFAVCLREVADAYLQESADSSTNFGATTAAAAVIVLTLAAETLLSYLAWGMIVDLDASDMKKLSKQSGGAPIGAIVGQVICGRNLRSATQNATDQSNRPDDANRQDLSCRHVVISITTPDLENTHEHRLQKVTTASVDDDASPEFRHRFHGSSGFTVYRSSRTMEIEVWDTLDPQHPVRVGAASVDLECDHQAGRMPDQDYIMDGEEGNYVSINLDCLVDGQVDEVAAGVVRLLLAYIPEPDLLGATTQTVLQSWYFEGTVLFMVMLQMIVLAMQCPADPPEVVNFGAVKILEVFIATHMSIEILMELLVKANQGEHKFFYHDRWFVLSVVVLVCNWIAIAAPAMTLLDVLAAKAARLTDATGVSDAFADFTNTNSSNYMYAKYRALGLDISEIDGSKTKVASYLIANPGIIGLDVRKRVKKVLSVMRVFRAVRPLRTMRMLKHVNIILTVLEESATLFITVSLLLAFLLAVFALVGMTSFGGALQYECIGDLSRSAGTPACTDEQMYFSETLGHECPVRCPVTLACAQELGYEWCAPLQSGKRNIGGDTYGYRDFDNFGKAIVTMFVQMTGDGGMHTIPLACKDAGCTADSAAWATSFVATLMLNLVALNLFLALCCSAYSNSAAGVEEVEAEKKRLRTAKRVELIAQGVLLDEPDDKSKAVPYDQALAAKTWPKDSSRCPLFRSIMYDFVLNKWFERSTSLLILANTVVMAVYHEDMDEDAKDFLRHLETGFLMVFTSEAVVKVLGMGSELYWRSTENRFDATVVAASLVGFIATHYIDEIQSLTGFKADLQVVQSLRAFRLLRALQLLRFMHRQRALMDVLKTVFKAWRPLAIHSVFCAFSLCMFAVIGMHVLGGSLGTQATFEDYDTECHTNLESFERAAMTVFQLTVGENWSHTMWWYMRYASLAYGYPRWTITAMFLVMFIWMNCILFSLYVAMLLENFKVDEKEKPELQKRMWGRQQRRARRDEASEISRHLARNKGRGHAHAKISSTYDILLDAAKHTVELDAPRNKSCGYFRLDSKVRLAAARIQSSKAFSQAIMSLIGFSCISLALGGPPGHGSGFADRELEFLLYVANSLVLIAFIVEATIKCIVHGILRPSGPTEPYLRFRMNQIDALIILINLACYLPFVSVDGTFARVMRMGRLVTPILNLSKNPEIKLVFVSFVRAAPDTAIMMVPLALLVLVFSIIGVAVFGSVLSGCASSDDPMILLPDDAFPFGNETLCRKEDSGYVWARPIFNFDSTGHAFATLFVAMTDGANEIMRLTTAHNRLTQIYWVLFHLSFTTFFLNLFIGVLSASFEKTSGIALKTLWEKQWEAVMNELAAFRPVSDPYAEMAPDSESLCCKHWRTPKVWYRFRRQMFDVATNTQAVFFWRIVIIVNVSTLACEAYPGGTQNLFAGLTVQQMIKAVNIVCLMLNCSEVVIKLFGFGLVNYFSDGWMISDLLLVLGSTYLLFFGANSGLEVLRVIRVLRMIVLASKLPSLVSLIDTLVRCVRASLAMILITSLTVYLFAVLGMNLFGSLPSADVVAKAGLDPSLEQQYRESGTIISAICKHCSTYTDSTNFNSFSSGVFLLVQSAFGQGIGYFIAEINYLGGSYFYAIVFFGVYFVAIVWVSINLLLVTILNNFEAATTEGHSGALAITPTDLDGYSYVWASLTVGPQGSLAMEDNEVRLLEHLATVLAEEQQQQGLPYEDPTTVNFEDGDPELCGTLTIFVEELSGFSKTLDLRPYCTVQVDGESGTCEHSMFTPTTAATLGKGVASWQKVKKDGTKGRGAKLKCHVTSVQDELNFCVRNSYAFCDGWVGGVRVSLDDIRSQPRQTMTLKLRANKADFVETELGSQPNHWQRFNRFKKTTEKKIIVAQRVIKGFAAFEATPSTTDPGADSETAASADKVLDENEPVGALSSGPSTGASQAIAVGRDEEEQRGDDEDGEVEDPAERKRIQKLKRIAEKKEAKRRKRAKKEAARLEKKRAKEAKKAAKLAKKLAKKQSIDLGLPEQGSDGKGAMLDEPEGEDNEAPHKFYRDGWEENGVQLKVTFKFQPKLSLVRSTTFQKDFRTMYVNKETSCGIEGWLEFSDRPNGRFVRRFCYLQQDPQPCLKICTRGKDIFELEKIASTDALKLDEVLGSNIRSISAGEDPNAFIVRGAASSGKSDMQEEQIGLITGTVLQATNVPIGGGGRKPLICCLVELVSRCDEEKQGKLLCWYRGHRGSRGLKKAEFTAVDVSVSRSGILTVGVDADGSTSGKIEVDLTGSKTNIGEPKMGRGMNVSQLGSFDEQLGDLQLLSFPLQVQAGSPSHTFIFQFDSEAEHKLWRSAFVCAADLASETKTQGYPTVPVESDTVPKGVGSAAAATWNQDFDLNVFPSTSGIILRIFQGNPGKGIELGAAEINIAHAVRAGDFGPTLSGDSLGQNTTAVLSRTPKTVRVSLTKSSSAAAADSTADAEERAGEVEIQLDYVEMVPNGELKQTRQAHGSLCAAMMVPATTSHEYHFRATRSDIARQWTAALRWVATGCSFKAYSQNFVLEGLPSEEFSRRELRRLERNISLVDLPFARVSKLLAYLYNMRVMGSHKPTMRRSLYTVFNLETFAWNADAASERHKASIKANGRSSALYLNEVRGINFHKCLERLALLHYGKHRCLNYEKQMEEYNIELKQASLLVVSTWVSWWVFRRTKTVQGHSWPWATAWKKYPNAYACGMDGVLASRMRSLKTLLREVEKRKPALADVELKPRETATRKAYKARKAASAAKQNRKELRALFQVLDLDGDGTLDQEEFTAAMGRLGSADAADLESVLGSLVVSEGTVIDESVFVQALSGVAIAARKDAEHWIWKLQIHDGTSDGRQSVTALTRGSNKLIHDKKKVMQKLELGLVFASIDTDGNGTLDEEEFRDALGKINHAEGAAEFEAILGDLVQGDTEITEEVFVDALSTIADTARNDEQHWVWRLTLNEDDLDEDLDELDADMDELDAEYLSQVAE